MTVIYSTKDGWYIVGVYNHVPTVFVAWRRALDRLSEYTKEPDTNTMPTMIRFVRSLVGMDNEIPIDINFGETDKNKECSKW